VRFRAVAWHKDSIVTFNLPELDSTKRYDLFINVRDNNDYQFNNLFFNCGVELPNGFTK
jgi:gliding motility-associated lipoprotein GldH